MEGGKRFLECCCTSIEEALEAEAGGASRIELCADLSCGGVTPERETIEKTISKVKIPVNVLVRPRGGHFVYSEEEISRMAEDIRVCKSLGANAVVIGVLDEEGNVDTGAMRFLMERAEGMEVTFHRAFDECKDPFKALEDIIALGCNRILTAGHAGNVNDGMDTLKKLHEAADGRITILAGSGVRPANIARLEEYTGIKEFHSSSHGPEGTTSRETVSKMVDKGNEVPLWKIFLVFAKIGAFTIGGGYAMIPIIRDELVKREWLTDEELPDILALAQSAPGILAVNMSIFAGHKMRGTKGSIAATLGTILPSFAIILLIAMVFSGYKDNPVIERIFKGIRPVVVSLIIVPMVNMARKGNKTWWAWLISVLTLVAVAFLGFSPIWILLVLIVLAVISTMYKERRSSHG